MEEGVDGKPRPVLRLGAGSSRLICTRWNADDPKSSILMHIRPGWRALHTMLCGAAMAEVVGSAAAGTSCPAGTSNEANQVAAAFNPA